MIDSVLSPFSGGVGRSVRQNSLVFLCSCITKPAATWRSSPRLAEEAKVVRGLYKELRPGIAESTARCSSDTYPRWGYVKSHRSVKSNTNVWIIAEIVDEIPKSA